MCCSAMSEGKLTASSLWDDAYDLAAIATGSLAYLILLRAVVSGTLRYVDQKMDRKLVFRTEYWTSDRGTLLHPPVKGECVF